MFWASLNRTANCKKRKDGSQTTNDETTPKKSKSSNKEKNAKEKNNWPQKHGKISIEKLAEIEELLVESLTIKRKIILITGQ